MKYKTYVGEALCASITPGKEVADELADASTSKYWECVDDEVVDSRLKDTPKSLFRDIMSEADEPDHTDKRVGSGNWDGLRIPGDENGSKSGVCSNDLW